VGIGATKRAVYQILTTLQESKQDARQQQATNELGAGCWRGERRSNEMKQVAYDNAILSYCL
jgi:hypothetical protein